MLRRLLAAFASLAALAAGASAAQRRESLIYSRFDVDPGEWRYFEFPAKEAQGRFEARFEVEGRGESPGVRLRLLRGAEFERYRQNQPAAAIGETPYRRRGHLAARLEAGQYVLLVESPAEGPRRSRVELEATLLTGPDPETLPVAYASPARRRVVVAVSLAVFALILMWGGGALWRAARASRPAPPLSPLY